jgi:tRNA/rRNA methyltransferase
MSDTTHTNNCKNHLSIVIVEPQGALNVGAIARVMKNMGLFRLVLVNPQCDYLGEEAQRMAVHAKDILAQAKLVDSLATALAPCQRIIATTARERTLRSPLETPRQALPWLLAPNLPSALVFGREDSGLSNEELNHAHRFVKIPVDPGYSALNLAQAVAVCAYELHQASLAPVPPVSAPQEAVMPPVPDQVMPLADAASLDRYYQHLEKTLLDIQVLYPHTAAARMAKLKRIYQRSGLSEDELALLRGILGQVDWLSQQLAAQNSHCHQPSGEL